MNLHSSAAVDPGKDLAARTEVPVRLVTSAALFDGHDASINIIRRLLMKNGAEVIHLGHNRSAAEIVNAAIQEDVQGIAISSYQGGHNEFFRYIIDLLRERGAGHIKVFGGGGGVIVPREIRQLEDYGVERIYSPEDGRKIGIAGIAADMTGRCRFDPSDHELDDAALSAAHTARAITGVERAVARGQEVVKRQGKVPVLGVTGTGGAGKSSLLDELIRWMGLAAPQMKIGLLLVDPTKRSTGGALLADRIRLNAANREQVFVRSLATRAAGREVTSALEGALAELEARGFDLIIVETSGIGQGDAAITEFADQTLYVMTPEFGAPSQLEKIDMLDLADFVAINKFERRGAEDALRDVRRQLRRNRDLPHVSEESLPVYGTVASHFNDAGVRRLFDAMALSLKDGFGLFAEVQDLPEPPERLTRILPTDRTGYLGEIARCVESYHDATQKDAAELSTLQALARSQAHLNDTGADTAPLEQTIDEVRQRIPPEAKQALETIRQEFEQYQGEEYVYSVRDRKHHVTLFQESLSGSKIPKIALPQLTDDGDLYRFLRGENLPGHFPYTAGVYPFRRADEDPRRQFAGEGGPARTNRRFHYLSRHDTAKRLSVAFDSVTLYGEDPDERPDIYGKIGEGGVSICTLDDMKVLMEGFDLCDRNTSVSMTINGPAPIVLAFFLNTAIDQQVERRERELGRALTEAERERTKEQTLHVVRGTVQADILKEDQAQNTCLFAVDFALKLMGDIQEYFTNHHVRNFYSVSVSGYHIAEAGANPISQLAFTLANGFTYVEYYLSRGLQIDDFARNLSFFFSNGLDPEYSVLGRVARRVWAVAMRELYGANDRSQRFKYHIQTSGRSLHAMEIDFNDIRTTLQALMAVNDNCNSLHTNAYDEAITTPTEQSVRRAMAIQMIISKELGVARNENPLQGSFLSNYLTDLVEAAVLEEFQRLNDRGGVLGAMETHYQRGRIQEESLLYETKKDSGELPVVGVNCFERHEDAESGPEQPDVELARATTEEKDEQIARLRSFQASHAKEAPAALKRLQETAIAGGNVFAEIMECVRVASLGQVTHALYEVGGQYRRSL